MELTIELFLWGDFTVHLSLSVHCLTSESARSALLVPVSSRRRALNLMAINIFHSTTLPGNADCPTSKNDYSVELEMIWVEASAANCEVLYQIYLARLRKDMTRAGVICGVIFFFWVLFIGWFLNEAQRFGSCFCFRLQGRKALILIHWVQWLRIALFKGSARLGALLAWRRKKIRFPKHSAALTARRWTKSKTETVSVSHIPSSEPYRVELDSVPAEIWIRDFRNVNRTRNHRSQLAPCLGAKQARESADHGFIIQQWQ
jgi:hypothetical protein